MKKILVAAIAIIGLTTAAFATDGNRKASYWVLEQFNNTYASATDVNWNVTADFAKATFLLDGIRVEAFYGHDGNFIGQSKAVSTQSLPFNAQRSLKKKYSGYMVKETIEFSNASDVDFFVSLENATEKLILKISRNGEISEYKRVQL